MADLDTSSALAKKQRALLLSVVTTACSLLPTIYVTLIANSIILYADLLRCVVEFLAIVFSWLILGHIGRSDRSHFNYGFGKLEQLASLAVAFAMLLSFVVVMVAAVGRFLSPQVVHDAGQGFVLGNLSVLGNGAMWAYYRALGRSENSAVIDSQARLFRAKTAASVIVVVALVPFFVSGPGWLQLYADPVGSVLLSGFLLHSSVALFSSSMGELVDASIDERLQLLILGALIQHEALYSGFKEVRSRRVGNRILVELFLEFTAKTTMSEFAESSAALKNTLHSQIPDIEVTIIPTALASR